MIPGMLELWNRLSGDPSLKFLLLTNDMPVPDRSVDSALQPPGLVRRSVDRGEVPRYLSASDIGFLLRDRHPLNWVASPVKLAEYLASGLSVVTTEGLGDTSELVERSGVGTVVDLDDIDEAVRRCEELISDIKRDRNRFRERAVGVASDKLDWRAHAAEWERLIAGGHPR